MPPIESSGGPVTRSSNSNKHPGLDAQKALQTRQCRAPEVIKAEKEVKAAAKEARKHAKEVEVNRKEAMQRKAKEYRAQQEAAMEKAEGETARRQHVEGNFITVRGVLN